jgi:pre-mRNA-processing factor 6
VAQGISRFPNAAKLYMIGGQISADDLPKARASLDKARKFYQNGLNQCPTNTTLWILASRLEEKVSAFASEADMAAGVTKARGLLEIGRIKNPKNACLWLEAVRLERRSGNQKLADALMAKALQECPSDGSLLAENIYMSPRVQQKSKSADAIKRCPEDPRVIAAVASLFASDRKIEKARKWFDRAVLLDPDLGDSWARFYAFELRINDQDRLEAIRKRCVQAAPRHGELWAQVLKEVSNRTRSTSDILEMVSKKIISETVH